MGNAYPDSTHYRFTMRHHSTTSAVFGSAFASCCGWADGNKAMVPREGNICNHRRDEPLFVLSMVA